MGRQKFSRDKKPRKRRCDRKHKYRKRHGKFVPYVSKRKRSDLIKAWVWEVRPMDKDSYKRWNKDIRAKIIPVVYKPLLRIDTDPERLSTKEEIGKFMIEAVGYSGKFILKLFGHAKNKFHCTNRTVAKITIKETGDGLKAFVTESWRISRYWFWRKQ